MRLKEIYNITSDPDSPDELIDMILAYESMIFGLKRGVKFMVAFSVG
jgi:hypothetical protein